MLADRRRDARGKREDHPLTLVRPDASAGQRREATGQRGEGVAQRGGGVVAAVQAHQVAHVGDGAVGKGQQQDVCCQGQRGTQGGGRGGRGARGGGQRECVGRVAPPDRRRAAHRWRRSRPRARRRGRFGRSWIVPVNTGAMTDKIGSSRALAVCTAECRVAMRGLRASLPRAGHGGRVWYMAA